MRPYATWIERRIGDIGRAYRAVRASDVGVHVAVPKLFQLVLNEKFSPTEVQMLGLLESCPVVPDTYVSKRQMLALQRRANPPDSARLCEDKIVFYKKCVENGLATPRVFAAVGLTPFETYGLPMVDSPDALRNLFEKEGPSDFVIKPVAGAHGQGVTGFKFDGRGCFTDGAGKRTSPEDIFAHISQWDFQKWFLQQRIFPHPDLVRLSGSQSLQTSRVVTCLDRDEPFVAIAYLRIIGGKEVWDNFNFGTSGNLLATIDVSSGRLLYVFGPIPLGTGITTHAHHPVTGVRFDSLTVPFMPEICELTMRAGRVFKPLRTVGWDVAITSTGAMLIEGNPWWDPLPTQQNMRAIAASLQ